MNDTARQKSVALEKDTKPGFLSVTALDATASAVWLLVIRAAMLLLAVMTVDSRQCALQDRYNCIRLLGVEIARMSQLVRW
jgi:hypothetical protein